eukprot:m.237849 g.237849  ORF g.237849 m.237849 type:complete len:857 (+) comp18961_c1_seq1:198-2768(+)
MADVPRTPVRESVLRFGGYGDDGSEGGNDGFGVVAGTGSRGDRPEAEPMTPRGRNDTVVVDGLSPLSPDGMASPPGHTPYSSSAFQQQRGRPHRSVGDSSPSASDFHRSHSSSELEGYAAGGGDLDNSLAYDVFGSGGEGGDVFFQNGTRSDGLARRRGPGATAGGARGLPDHLRSPLEGKKDELNGLFGTHKWKGHLSKRPLEERSEVVKQLYQDDPLLPSSTWRDTTISVGNVLYAVFFAWIALVYLLVGGLMCLTVVGRVYWPFCSTLARYFAWPFGKYVLRAVSRDVNSDADHHHGRNHEAIPLLLASDGKKTPAADAASSSSTSMASANAAAAAAATTSSPNPYQHDSTAAYFAWCFFVPLLWLVHGLALFACTFAVVTMPMAKLHWRTLRELLYVNPHKLTVGGTTTGPTAGSEIVVCVFSAVNIFYYKYSLAGMNIVLVNLLAFVILSICFGYIPFLRSLVDSSTIFIMSLLSIIPLAYYIGMAISSISAQSTYAVGAVLNATFGSIVELLLYFTALRKGLSALVIASLTGSLLATMLFIPGICMIIGGLKFKEQRFNMRSAGISSSLLFVSVAGAYSPSLFHRVFGAHDLACSVCLFTNGSTALSVPEQVFTPTANLTGWNCMQCHRQESYFWDDPVYLERTRPLVFGCASLLPVAYIVGLIFTLSTHSAEIYSESPDASHGAVWSRRLSSVILLVATVLMGAVAESLVDTIQDVISSLGVSEIFIGASVIALIPDIAEVVNGIQFARQNNIALSIEVGSSIAVQVCLIQMPVLVLLSEVFKRKNSETFTMIFNDVYIWTVFVGVIVMNYTFQDGKSDYFQGTTLVIVYCMLMLIIYFTPEIDVVPPA